MKCSKSFAAEVAPSVARLVVAVGLAVSAMGAQAVYTDVNLVGDESVLEGVYDSGANLTWLKDWSAGGKLTQPKAIAFADAATYGDVSGWRLPTQAEYLAATKHSSSFTINSTSYVASGQTTAPDGSFGPRIVMNLGGNFWMGGNSDPATTNYFALIHDGNVSLSTVAAVPEPQTYALMMAGLAVLGSVARKRRQA